MIIDCTGLFSEDLLLAVIITATTNGEGSSILFHVGANGGMEEFFRKNRELFQQLTYAEQDLDMAVLNKLCWLGQVAEDGSGSTFCVTKKGNGHFQEEVTSHFPEPVLFALNEIAKRFRDQFAVAENGSQS